jgi:hypothetical protein
MGRPPVEHWREADGQILLASVEAADILETVQHVTDGVTPSKAHRD